MNEHTPGHAPWTRRRRAAWAGGLLVLVGCSSAPPLMFADNVSMGLQLGNQTASGGGSVSLGYKHRSVAIVPVAAVDGQGRVGTALSTDVMPGGAGTRKDALSVFAVFEGSAEGGGPLRVGQAFATGIAAQRLTEGYACKLGDTSLCAPAPATPQAAASATPQVAAAAAEPAAGRPPAPAPAPAPASPAYPYPLIYARADVLGLDVAGSAAEQGTSFTFGFGSRNVALVPVVAANADGSLAGLKASDGATPAGQDKDAFSVLGQFASNTETRSLGFCLERYFATGMAAQNLGRGLGAAAAAQRASAPAAAASAPRRCI